MNSVQAGAAVLDITSPVGDAMGGYGARTEGSTGIHDPLNVRTLVLSDGETTIAVAICDFVGVGPEIVSMARDAIEQSLGIPAQNVCIAATHTHSGPAAVRAADESGFQSVTAKKIAGSVRVALSGLRPVALKVGTSEVSTISQNRRDPEGPIETTAKVLLAAPPGGQEPVATLVNYACHATVLEHDNLLYSADFPGAAARFVEGALGGKCIYMQGACGDVNPVWMRHDFEEVERVGGIVGAAAVRTAHELRPLGEGQWAVNLSWSERTPKDPAPGTVLTDVRLKSASTFLDLPRKVLPDREEIERQIGETEAELEALAEDDVDARRALRPRLNALRMDRAAKRQYPARPGDTQRVEIQAFRLAAECAMVALPGEFFVETAREIERRAGVEHLLVSCYANDYAGYVVPAHEFPRGGYEVGRSRFGPDVAESITDDAAALVRSLYEGSPQ